MLENGKTFCSATIFALSLRSAAAAVRLMEQGEACRGGCRNGAASARSWVWGLLGPRGAAGSASTAQIAEVRNCDAFLAQV